MGLFDGGCVGGLGDGEDFVVALGLVHGSWLWKVVELGEG